jgi:hypothetical protein
MRESSMGSKSNDTNTAIGVISKQKRRFDPKRALYKGFSMYSEPVMEEESSQDDLPAPQYKKIESAH